MMGLKDMESDHIGRQGKKIYIHNFRQIINHPKNPVGLFLHKLSTLQKVKIFILQLLINAW